MSKQSQFESQCEKAGINSQKAQFLWNFLKTQPEEMMSIQPQVVSFKLSQEAKKIGTNIKRTLAHELISIFIGLKNRHVLASQTNKSINLEEQFSKICIEIDSLISTGNTSYSKAHNGYNKHFKLNRPYSDVDHKIESLIEKAQKIMSKQKNQFINNIPEDERRYYKICLIRNNIENYITILTKETSPQMVLSNYFNNNTVPSNMFLCAVNPITEISREEYENFTLSNPF